MLTEFVVKRGFGPGRTKEYFVVETDGDTMSGVIAGPFENKLQGSDAMEALRPMYNRRLRCIGGHLDSGQEFVLPKLEPAGNPPADLD